MSELPPETPSGESEGASCQTGGRSCPACGGQRILLIGLAAFVTLYLATSYRENSAPAVPSAVAWTEDYEQALAQAADKREPVLLAFKATWCGPCRRMDSEVFSQKEAAAALADWIPVHIDIDDEPAIATKHEVSGVPTFVALSPDGREINRVAGTLSLTEFAAFVASSKQKLAQSASLAG